MKIFIVIMISLTTLLTVNYFLPQEQDFQIYEDTLRLHVLANSDSAEDQALKLKVRDVLLDEMNSLKADSKEQAVALIEENKKDLMEKASEVIKQEGKAYSISIDVGQEFYPTRQYEGFSLPSGEYTSVIVTIGKGDGQNWWCVLYPPLCTYAAIKMDEEACLQVGLTKNQYDLITSNESGQYKIKFKLLEIAAEAFGFKYE